MSLMLAFVVMVASGTAAAAPAWRIGSLSDTTVAPGGALTYVVQVTNTGDVATTDPYTVHIVLPSGMTAIDAGNADTLGDPSSWACDDGNGGSVIGAIAVRCVNSQVRPVGSGSNSGFIVDVAVDNSVVDGDVLTARLDIVGGDPSNPTASISDPTRVSSVPPEFGVDAFDGDATDVAGGAFTQAGGHPFGASTSIDFNTETNLNPLIGPLWPVEPPKDVLVDLPPGFVGNPTVAAQCTASDLANAVSARALPLCAPASQVGTTFVRINGLGSTNVIGPLPVFNMVPPPDVPARFGFNVSGTVVTLNAHLRSGSDYGLSVSVDNISEGLAIAGTSLTFWGVPADSSHDRDRACPGNDSPALGGPTCSAGLAPQVFLRNPTSCTPAGVGLRTTLHMDSWTNPGTFREAHFDSHLPPGYPVPPSEWGAAQGPTGCEKVPFEPTLSGGPAVSDATVNAPAGFVFDLALPQNSEPSAIGEGDLKKAVVTLPAGVRVSPGVASGLQGCSPSEIGLHTTDDPSCPDGSKVGSLTIDTPLLDKPLTGSVYVASPYDNPFGSLVAVYLVAKAPGVIVKVAGKVEMDPGNGRVTATFDDQPQLPFSNLHLEFKGGPRAPLVTPVQCGTYTTHAELTSWSGKTVASTSSFSLSADGHGAPCPSRGFAPAFSAGTENPVSGVFSAFSLQLQRTDDDGEFKSLSSLSLPPGLLADVGSVATRCTIERADAHSCPVASHIGEVTAGAGVGSNPFYVGGDVYLTTPYKGNPFGIAVIVHAQAGPFDLGYVVVKGAIQIHDDGSVTVATDPFPTILQGIPLQIKDIRVNIDRPGFMFNPTSCDPMSINGTVLSTADQQAGVSSRFQVGECANLAFKPVFTVSTAGKTSKANGASLHVHIATHQGPGGTGATRESNIAKVDVQLPVVLPARLPTLQKACTAAQFATDPAGCPVGSFVGTAIAHTPILTGPLSGPAILVSHGGEAFPDLVLVLQGEGVRINLTGHTQIKKGITFSHFETVPDAPVSSFDLTLPQGPHAVLTTDVPGRNLCATTRTVTVTRRVTRRVHGHARKVRVKAKKAIAAPLLMPTTITAQNGAALKQTTKIAVTGCAAVKTKAKKATTKKK